MNKIIKILKKRSLPLDKFINVALYDKKFGYYMKKNPFGEKGDFITAPNISRLFSEMIAIWIVSFWQSLGSPKKFNLIELGAGNGEMMKVLIESFQSFPLISNLFGEMIAIWCVSFWENLGKPNKIVLVELGPGDGTLCQDFINAIKNFKDFYHCVEINLLEKSKLLKKIQQGKLKNTNVKWINNINEINDGPIIFIGNEFFDSLPIKQIYKKKKLLLERYVSLLKNEKKIKFLHKKANKNLIKSIEKLNLISSGKIIEYPKEAIKYLNKIASKINKYSGGLLTFDYGYLVPKNKNTLQCIQNHKYVNFLSDPGNADITSGLI